MRKDDGYQRDFWNEKTRDQEEQIPNTDSNSMSISMYIFIALFIGALVLIYFLVS
ncbi:MAG: hypothetical protein WCZ00_04385 [Acholeplasmataceae bacterium]